MAIATTEMVRKLKFRLLTDPSYSPDLAPSDYHIFRPLTDVLHGYQFANDEEVKDMVHTWFFVQLKPFFTNGIRKLMQ
jgi:hypothetical protein